MECVPRKKIFYSCLCYPVVTLKRKVEKTDHEDPESSVAVTTPDLDSVAIALSSVCVNQDIKPNVKCTLKQARTVDSHSLNDYELTSADKILQYILKTLMLVDYNARQFEIRPLVTTKDNDKTNNSDDFNETDDKNELRDNNSNEQLGEEGINPLDALLWVFHRSDNVLRRYLVVKLSECQLSVPFLLPDPAAPSKNVTLLLSA